ELAVRLFGDVAGAIEQKTKLPDDSENFAVFAEQNSEIAPAANALRVSTFGNLLENEPNNNVSQATTVDQSPPFALNGVIGEPGDVDFFKFKPKGGQTFDLRVYARALRSPLDSVLKIFDAKGKQLASNDDAGSAD